MEILSESFRLVNFPFTVLLLLLVLYWLLVAFGAISSDHGMETDADLDFHHEADLDAHHHVEGHHHAHHDAGSTGTMLKFLNLGEVPVMVVLSVLVLSTWTFSMVANHYWTGDSTLLKGVALAANLVLSVVITRYVTMPLRPLFRALNRQHEEAVKIIGEHCRIVTSEATGEFGQAEISTKGVPLLINVRTLNDAVLHKGDLAVVVREDEDRRIFFITANPLPEHTNH